MRKEIKFRKWIITAIVSLVFTVIFGILTVVIGGTIIISSTDNLAEGIVSAENQFRNHMGIDGQHMDGNGMMNGRSFNIDNGNGQSFTITDENGVSTTTTGSEAGASASNGQLTTAKQNCMETTVNDANGNKTVSKCTNN